MSSTPRPAGRAASGRAAPRPRRLGERDLRSLALRGIADLEERLRGEAALVGDDRAGELLDPRVVGLDVRVVDPAGRLDLVLQLRELALELLEVLGCAELGILLGDHAQAAKRLVELSLRLAG